MVNFQPHALYVNRIGRLLYIRQFNVDDSELLDVNDPPKVVLWRSDKEPELIKVYNKIPLSSRALKKLC